LSTEPHPGFSPFYFFGGANWVKETGIMFVFTLNFLCWRVLSNLFVKITRPISISNNKNSNTKDNFAKNSSCSLGAN
ncbi:hypothetical protein, partial [Campylobacter coli]|uniref:hypothetical protein n=1 Tax=Campylobacter coli TaxID=195 RepID=UPI0037F4ED34